MRTPFDWVREGTHGRLLLALSVALLISSSGLMMLDARLVTADSPHGIASFELAGTRAGARSVLSAWSAPAREAAHLIQGFDFLHMLVYPAWLSLCLVQLRRRCSAATLGHWLGLGAWGVLIATPLEAVENVALVYQLNAGASESAATLARFCALPKLGLVGLASCLILLGGLARLLDRKRG